MESEEIISNESILTKRKRLATTEIADGVTACIPGYKCAVCGKSFILHVSQGQNVADYAYKIRDGATTMMCCSWHCLQSLRKKVEEKRVKGGYLKRGKREVNS